VDYFPQTGGSLETLEFGDEIEEIGFIRTDFSKLRTLKLPKNLKKISYSNLTEYIAKASKNDYVVMFGNLLIKYQGREKLLSLPQNITNLLDHCFEGNELTDIVLNNHITELPRSCFANCVKLQHISISDQITVIPENCFENCLSLTEMDIPKQIFEIKGYAFKGCKTLRKVNLHEGIVTIGTGVFEGCPNLEEIVLPDSIHNLGFALFNDNSAIRKMNIPKQAQPSNLYLDHVNEVHYSNPNHRISDFIRTNKLLKVYFHDEDNKVLSLDASKLPEKYKELILRSIFIDNDHFEIDIFAESAAHYSSELRTIYQDYLRDYVIDKNLQRIFNKKTDLAKFDPGDSLKQFIQSQDIDSIKILLENKHIRVHISRNLDQYLKCAVDNQALEATTLLMNTFYSSRDGKNSFEL